MIIENSISQLRLILKSMRESNEENTGITWQEALYYCEFIEEEVNRIERNIKLNSNIQHAIDQTNCFGREDK